ncbi:hypothetical protein DFJ73DRAFT_966211 [Zopfochytrium polystomum]|nr:hypothetical protein DFJ73DRAFT_966211 [Zopfochytrium polystomum]
MRIYARTLDPHHPHLLTIDDVLPVDTVARLKALLEAALAEAAAAAAPAAAADDDEKEEEEEEEEEQESFLVFSGRRMDEARTLGDYGVSRESTVHLVVRRTKKKPVAPVTGELTTSTTGKTAEAAAGAGGGDGRGDGDGGAGPPSGSDGAVAAQDARDGGGQSRVEKSGGGGGADHDDDDDDDRPVELRLRGALGDWNELGGARGGTTVREVKAMIAAWGRGWAEVAGARGAVSHEEDAEAAAAEAARLAARGPRAADVHLIFAGRILNDDARTLASYGIRRGSYPLTLVWRVSGG